MFKKRNAHCRTWSMPENRKIMENEKLTEGPGICLETVKNEKNVKYTLYDLDYGEKP
jgi:hypothetical protein